MDAIIFDMDGVVSDTQKIHAQEISKVLATLGVHITPAKFSQDYAGVSLHNTLLDLEKQFGVAIDYDIVNVARSHVLTKLREGVDSMPDAVSVVKQLSQNYPLALASTSSLELIDVVLAQLGIKDCFTVISSGHEVVNGKPSPDIFLLAAQRLGVEPGRCVVIEDGVVGMRAAQSAGMFTIGYDIHHRVDLPAHQVVTELAAIPFILETLKKKEVLN